VAERLADRKFWLIFGAILLLAAVLRVLAFSPFDTIAHDEILQYQERAYRMVFGYGLVPWESRYGIRNALIPDLIAAAMAGTRLFSSDPGAAVMAGRIVVAIVCFATVPVAYALGSARSRSHGLVAMFVAAVWFESVLFGVHVLSESVALPFACGGAAALLRARENGRAAMLAGFLLGIAVLLRLQFAVFAGTLVLLSAGRDWTLYRRLAIGALPALAIGAATDLAAGMAPFAWVAKNLSMNLLHGRAEYFGTFGPFYYVTAVFLRLLPLSLVIVGCAFFVEKRYRPLLFAAIANIAVHSLIGHKEYRFIWLSTFVFVVLAALTSVDLVDRLRARRQASPESRPMALTLLCLSWAGLSYWSLVATGGFAALRDGGKIAEATIEAAKYPDTCGIGVTILLRKPFAYAFVRRDLGFYLVPDAVDGGRQPFPAPLTEAVNTLVLTDKARPPAAYHRLSCEQDVLNKVCLYYREGGCRTSKASQDYTYQAISLRNDM
jgi:hypothetical protein